MTNIEHGPITNEVSELTDILYDKTAGVAMITINRPQAMNSFRAQTIQQLIWAFRDAWDDQTIGTVILTGAGEKAFCAGGDQKSKGDEGGYDYNGGRIFASGYP